MTDNITLPRAAKQARDDCDDCIVFDGLDDALVGTAAVRTENGAREARAIYSGPKIVEILMGEGLTQDEAMEHIQFNIEGGYFGPKTPIVFWPDRLGDFSDDD